MYVLSAQLTPQKPLTEFHENVCVLRICCEDVLTLTISVVDFILFKLPSSKGVEGSSFLSL